MRSVLERGFVILHPVPHRVVLGAHDRLRVPRHSVVDVRRPDSREREHGHVRVVVARNEEQTDHVRARLCCVCSNAKGDREARGRKRVYYGEVELEEVVQCETQGGSALIRFE